MHTLGDTYKLFNFVVEQGLLANISACFYKSDIKSQSVIVMVLHSDVDKNVEDTLAHFDYF